MRFAPEGDENDFLKVGDAFRSRNGILYVVTDKIPAQATHSRWVDGYNWRNFRNDMDEYQDYPVEDWWFRVDDKARKRQVSGASRFCLTLAKWLEPEVNAWGEVAP